MKTRWYKVVVIPMLAVGLMLSPLSGYGNDVVSAATTKKTEDINLLVDGKKVKLTTPIYKANGVAMAPMKDFLDALEVSSVLEENSKSIIIRDADVTITMEIGKKEAIINGKTVKMETAAALKKDVPYVPIRFVAEQLEALVEWDNASNAIVVKTAYYLLFEELDEKVEEVITLEKLTSTEIVDKYDDSVVMIMTNRGQGSGVVIGEDLVLTNYHVMDDATSAVVNTNKFYDVEVTGVVAYSERTDLAIIRTEEPLNLEPVEIISKPQAQKGDRVYAIGSPLGVQNTVSTGLISNFTYEMGASYIQTNAQIDSGSSGGALFNEYGQLIGITSSGYENTSADLNFAVSVRHAATLLKDVTEKTIEDAKFLPPSLPASLVGLPLTDIQKLMVEQFSSIYTSEGPANFTNWEVKRDAEGWLVFNANIDPIFHMYYGESVADELRLWSVNLSHQLHSMLPDEKIQVVIYFQRDYEFKPRNLKPEDITSLGNDKWRVRYAVIDMQFKDQLYIQSRI